jgi:hypothetical protein
MQQCDSVQKPQRVVSSGTWSTTLPNPQGETQVMKKCPVYPPFDPLCHGKMKVNIPAMLCANQFTSDEFKKGGYA